MASRILIVDDDPRIRSLCQHALASPDLSFDEAIDGQQGLDMALRNTYDLVLLDVEMQRMNGLEVCRRLRENPPAPNLKIVMFSGNAPADELAQMMLAGADDFLTKPFSNVQLKARVRAALRLKHAQDRTDLLNRDLLTFNQELEKAVNARDLDLIHARNALVLALAKLAEYRDNETGAHLMRLQSYCRILAESAAREPSFATQLTPSFIEMFVCCSPLHDIGKVGLPDGILLKPGKLEPDERLIMQTHTVIGAETLKHVAQEQGFALVFLQMAGDIARFHHERYDGTGYPDRLEGNDIPLSARLLAVGDVYDALRSRRVYKPAYSHQETLEIMMQLFHGHFDPGLLKPFLRAAPLFDRAFEEAKDK